MLNVTRVIEKVAKAELKPLDRNGLRKLCSHIMEHNHSASNVTCPCKVIVQPDIGYTLAFFKSKTGRWWEMQAGESFIVAQWTAHVRRALNERTRGVCTHGCHKKPSGAEAQGKHGKPE